MTVFGGVVLVFWTLLTAVLVVLAGLAVFVVVRDIRELDEDEHTDIDGYWFRNRRDDDK